ncbi:TerB family tellurite resistance protein [Candidatus Pelagibacter sp.]|nr:TerB family tellurite resistance protein [Candidatus Pelagibacter sp.]MDB9987213.1 TerB family tellurite resistance protein [Candidatus Pelagibacter sp.]
MISFFKNKEKEEDTVNNDKSYSNIAALLIHVAKIDENYEDKEKEIIRKTLIELGATISNIDKLIADASVIEENSNQILSFTREVKNAPESDKIRIVESLWKIIYSDDNADMYETNLMRRLAGLLYIDAKTMGDLKEKVKKELCK